MSHPNKLLQLGLIGTVLAALCCFTPILVIVLSALGLAALTGYLDYVLLPALVFFVGLTGYAFWRQKKQSDGCGKSSDKEAP